MSDTAVDRLYAEAKEILHSLSSSGETSLALSAQDQLRKALLLAGASHFENVLSGCVNGFATEFSTSSLLIHLIRNKVVSRQFHSWFNWDGANANSFFAMFGPEFKAKMIKKCQDDADYQSSVRSFIELGGLRNNLVHQDFATFTLDKTLEEVYALYKAALPFVDCFDADLRSQ